MSFKERSAIWTRSFVMFLRETIVLCLSLLSGFSDALISTFLESFTSIYKQQDICILAIGLTFIPISAYLLSCPSYSVRLPRFDSLRIPMFHGHLGTPLVFHGPTLLAFLTSW